MADCVFELLPFHSLNNTELRNLLHCFQYKLDINLEINYKPLQEYIENNFFYSSPQSTVFKNLSIQEFNNELHSKIHLLTNGISVIHLNIRSLNANLEEFQTFVSSFSNPVDVFILTELWTTNIQFMQKSLQHYNFYTDLPVGTRVGGVGVFIRKNLQVFIRDDLKITLDHPYLCENIWLEVNNKTSRFLIAGLYRHPHHNLDNYIEKLELNLDKIEGAQPGCPCIIATDSNINLLKFESNAVIKNYINTLAMHNFFPMVLSPTRLTVTSATLIDHIYYNSKNKAENLCTISGNIM